MGERPLLEIVGRLAAGEPVRQIRDVRGTAYRLGASETPLAASQPDTITLPSYEEVAADKHAFAAMTRLLMHQTNPYTARRLVQFHGREAVVVNPPAWPLPQSEMDRIYGLPFTRQPHPSYGRRKIPAYEVVKDSIQIVRGCFGGCAFCSLSAHQGKIIQNRSRRSILEEIGRVAEQPDFSGVISDLAARPPTCTACAAARRRSSGSAAARAACTRRSARCW